MADIVSTEKRSEMMSHVHSKDIKPEETVRKYLFAQGFRYLKYDRRYPGKPDIVLPRYHTVVFVHGCFWHRHPNCSKATIPKSNQDFWLRKFEANIQRDSKVQRQLKEMGWHVVVVWECELSNKEKRIQRLSDLADEIRSQLE